MADSLVQESHDKAKDNKLESSSQADAAMQQPMSPPGPKMNRKQRRHLKYQQAKLERAASSSSSSSSSTTVINSPTPTPLPASPEVVAATATTSASGDKKRKQPQSSSSMKEEKAPQKRSKKKKEHEGFPYGNYSRYYGYRLQATSEEKPQSGESKATEDEDAAKAGATETAESAAEAAGDRESRGDPRFSLFKREWFENKHCLDVGCNSGYLTSRLARFHQCASMTGVDIDPKLIQQAQKSLDKWKKVYPKKVRRNSHWLFPYNISFHCENFVQPSEIPTTPTSTTLSSTSPAPGSSSTPSTKETPETTTSSTSSTSSSSSTPSSVAEGVTLETTPLVRGPYDVVLALSVTKWIQLNWGDLGILRFFDRIRSLLRAPGGRLILEPQPFSSYRKKKSHSLWKLHRDNLKALCISPNNYPAILLQMGFASVELIQPTVTTTTPATSNEATSSSSSNPLMCALAKEKNVGFSRQIFVCTMGDPRSSPTIEAILEEYRAKGPVLDRLALMEGYTA